MKRILLATLFVSLFITSCGNKVGEGYLQGSTFTVEDFRMYDGTAYNWIKNDNWGTELTVENETGTWTFNKDGSVNISMSADTPGNLYFTAFGFESGADWVLEPMSGRQDWFALSGDLYYQQFFIYEKSGGKITVMWEWLYNSGFGLVYAVDLKK